MFLKKDGSNYSTTNTFMQYNAKCDDAQIKLCVYFTLFQGSWVSKGLQYLTFLGIGARLLPVNGRDGPRIILQKLKPKPSHSSCWIVMYCSMSHLKNFHSYGDITVGSAVLQNVCLWPLYKGGILFMPRLLWHWTSVFAVSCEGLPHFVALYDKQGVLRIYS